MDAAQMALSSRDVAVETSQNLIQLVVDLGLLNGVSLEILEDLGIDHGTCVAARHFACRCVHLDSL